MAERLSLLIGGGRRLVVLRVRWIMGGVGVEVGGVVVEVGDVGVEGGGTGGRRV